MYPMNTPNQYNKPKPGERFSLKRRKIFLVFKYYETYNKAQQAAWQEEIDKKNAEELNAKNDNID